MKHPLFLAVVFLGLIPCESGRWRLGSMKGRLLFFLIRMRLRARRWQRFGGLRVGWGRRILRSACRPSRRWFGRRILI